MSAVNASAIRPSHMRSRTRLPDSADTVEGSTVANGLSVAHPEQHEVADGSKLRVRGTALNLITTLSYGVTDLEAAVPAAVAEQRRMNESLQAGCLEDVEALLLTQAVALNAVFNDLAVKARRKLGCDNQEFERYLRLALKAQNQSRSTLQTLAEIKSPSVVIARTANVAHGPQQVNMIDSKKALPDLMASSRGKNRKKLQNELLERQHALDDRAPATAV